MVHKATRPNYNESFFISHDRSADHPDIVAGSRCAGATSGPRGTSGCVPPCFGNSKPSRAWASECCLVLSRSLDMPAGHFAPFFENEAHINLRFLHYPPQGTEDDEQFGQAPHTDNSFITMLARRTCRGLAVWLPSGEWFSRQ